MPPSFFVVDSKLELHSALTSWLGEHPKISQMRAMFNSETLLKRCCWKTCTAQDLCVGRIVQSNNQTCQPCRKKRSSKISKDHQRSKLQIQFILAACCVVFPSLLQVCFQKSMEVLGYREKIFLHDFNSLPRVEPREKPRISHNILPFLVDF